MLNWLKWLIAGKELSELENIRSTITQYDRWLAEFDDICLILDNIENSNIHIDKLRDEVRDMRIKKNIETLKIVWDGYHHDFDVISIPTNNNNTLVVHVSNDSIEELLNADR